MSSKKSVFEMKDYREFLTEHLQAGQPKRGIQAEFARAMGCQASYLIQVLKGQAELTEDQTLRLAKHLDLKNLETEYLLTLLRQTRAASRELVGFLEQRRLALLEESQEFKNRIGAKSPATTKKFLGQYFSDPWPSTLHIATSSKSYQTVAALAERFGLSEKKVLGIMEFLEVNRLVRKENGNFVFEGESVHLPRNSPIHESHQVGRRLQALTALHKGDPENLHFSSVFTLDKKSHRELKKLFVQMAEKSHDVIHHGGTDEVYSICLDLFRVL